MRLGRSLNGGEPAKGVIFQVQYFIPAICKKQRRSALAWGLNCQAGLLGIATTRDSSDAGVAPLQEINSSEAQRILIIIIAIRNMPRNLAEASLRSNCFTQDYGFYSNLVMI